MTEQQLAFDHNDFTFSDRVLRLEIIPDDSLDSKPVSCVRKRKLRSQTEVYTRELRSQTLKEKENGDATHSNDDSEGSADLEVKTLHVSSAILAAKSPFFYKLFVNGMRESQESHFTLRINASEEAALMDLLNFVYNYTLKATTTSDLLNVLIIADKFEVISCMRYCSEQLLKLPMSLDLAQQYLDLPSSVLMAEAIQPLKDAANHHKVQINNLQEEAMALPLSSLEIVLLSDDLVVNSEDEVFSFILKWARAHYPKSEEYREILDKKLVPLIRFPYLTSAKLKLLMLHPDLNHEEVCKFVREALFFKAGLPYNEEITLSKERIYRYRPIKMVQFEYPWPRCIANFDLKKEECANLLMKKKLFSQLFYLGGRSICLAVRLYKDPLTSVYHFGLFVYMAKGFAACKLDYEFEVMMKPSEEFERVCKVENSSLVACGFTGKENLFGVPWTDFIAGNSNYFINGILRLRAELTMKL